MYIFNMPILRPYWEDTSSQLLKYVSLERQKKVLSYHFPIDRKLSLYSALLVRFGLSQISGIDAQDLKFHIGSYGKLHLLHPEGLYFNLSHTRNYILCGISAEGPIGVDVEKIELPPYEIMDKSFHPSEIKYIQESASDIRHQKFYEIWTKKEAYVKKCGKGLSLDIANVNTLDIDFASSIFTWMQDNYICTICYSQTNQPIKINRITTTEKDINNYFNS